MRLLLTDAVMPEEDGLSLINWAKLHAPTMACVLCSGYLPDASARRAISSGRIHFLAKPYTLPDALACFQAAMQERQPGRVTPEPPEPCP